MNLNRNEQIAQYAENLRKAFDVPSPLDFDKLSLIIKGLGGDLVDNPDLRNDGIYGKIVQTEKEKFIIEYDSERAEENITHTLAHELGHLFIHLGYLKNNFETQEYYDSPFYRNSYSIEEHEANIFADSFLIPKIDLKEKLDEMKAKTSSSIVDIATLAKYFGVTEYNIIKRGVELGYIRKSAE